VAKRDGNKPAIDVAIGGLAPVPAVYPSKFFADYSEREVKRRLNINSRLSAMFSGLLHRGFGKACKRGKKPGVVGTARHCYREADIINIFKQ
jgi:hypothetical protein